MELVTPEIGLIFWTTLSFLILLFILGKFAWKPILKSVNERESSIKDALAEAENARQEMEGAASAAGRGTKQQPGRSAHHALARVATGRRDSSRSNPRTPDAQLGVSAHDQAMRP